MTTAHGKTTRRPTSSQAGNSSGAGIGIDRFGAGAIDPSENVLALVAAQAIFQEKLDATAARSALAESAWIIKYFESLMAAEQRRVDGLAAQKKDYDNKIGETQTGQMKTTSDLVSTQLDKVTTSLSDSINKAVDNITASIVMLSDRLAKVEQFRYETGGKTSMTDPAMAGVLADIAGLKTARERTTGHGEEVTARTIAEALGLQKQTVSHGGIQNNIAIISVAVGLVIAVVSLAIAFIKQPPPIIDYGSLGSGIHSQRQLFVPPQSHNLMYRIRGDQIQ
jgi:hypothetical protein